MNSSTVTCAQTSDIIKTGDSGTTYVLGAFAREVLPKELTEPLLVFLRHARMPSVDTVKLHTACVSATAFAQRMVGLSYFL